MRLLHEQKISCPYCGEQIDVMIDSGEAGQQYIEDCQVCCQPIVFVIETDFECNLVASVHAENDTV